MGLNTIFEQISTLNGRIQKSKIKITEYEPPRIIAFTCSPVPIQARAILTPASGNTVLTITITLLSGSNPLIGFLWTSMARQDLQNGLKRLKVALESQSG